MGPWPFKSSNIPSVPRPWKGPRFISGTSLTPCYSYLFHSAWNSLLVPVQKPGSAPVQDLREVNKRVDSIHPTAPNPYALLTSLPPEHKVCSVLDLKDAFFSVPLLKFSQPAFTFRRAEPELGMSGQLTWTTVPQGFRNSPPLQQSIRPGCKASVVSTLR